MLQKAKDEFYLETGLHTEQITKFIEQEKEKARLAQLSDGSLQERLDPSQKIAELIAKFKQQSQLENEEESWEDEEEENDGKEKLKKGKTVTLE